MNRVVRCRDSDEYMQVSVIPEKELATFSSSLEEVKHKLKVLTLQRGGVLEPELQPPIDLGKKSATPDHANEKQTEQWAKEIFHMSSIAGLELPLNDVGIQEGLAAMQQKLCEAIQERDCMETFVKQLQDMDSDGGDDAGLSENVASMPPMMQLEEKSAMLNTTLSDLQERCVEIAAIKLELKANRRHLQQIENRYWASLYKLECDQSKMMSTNESAISRLSSTYYELTRLKRCYCFNDAFHIWYDGPFGTINGLRLGRLAVIQVPWDEINAAFGQVALLLSSLTGLLGVVIPNIELLPNGQHSKIKRHDGGPASSSSFVVRTHVLFYDASWNACSKLNQALAGLYIYLQELLALPLLDDKDLVPPYKIDLGGGDAPTIGGVPATITKNLSTHSMETWTRSLKYLLTDIKWLLIWASSDKDANTDAQNAEAVAEGNKLREKEEKEAVRAEQLKETLLIWDGAVKVQSGWRSVLARGAGLKRRLERNMDTFPKNSQNALLKVESDLSIGICILQHFEQTGPALFRQNSRPTSCPVIFTWKPDVALVLWRLVPELGASSAHGSAFFDQSDEAVWTTQGGDSAFITDNGSVDAGFFGEASDSTQIPLSLVGSVVVKPLRDDTRMRSKMAQKGVTEMASFFVIETRLQSYCFEAGTETQCAEICLFFRSLLETP